MRADKWINSALHLEHAKSALTPFIILLQIGSRRNSNEEGSRREKKEEEEEEEVRGKEMEEYSQEEEMKGTKFQHTRNIPYVTRHQVQYINATSHHLRNVHVYPSRMRRKEERPMV